MSEFDTLVVSVHIHYVHIKNRITCLKLNTIYFHKKILIDKSVNSSLKYIQLTNYSIYKINTRDDYIELQLIDSVYTVHDKEKLHAIACTISFVISYILDLNFFLFEILSLERKKKLP